MKVLHLTDEEIQEYALDSSTSGTLMTGHVSSCEECKARVANYQLLFSGIKQQPPASFDFDLAELVITQLPSPKTKASRDNFFAYLFIIVAIVLAGAVLYYFKSYIVSLFASIAPLFIYLTITTVITLSIILGLDMCKNYQKKMRSLDFY
ncbi:MAG: hypothetical protein ABI675_03885 [Chitinophagaceae bacterium]